MTPHTRHLLALAGLLSIITASVSIAAPLPVAVDPDGLLVNLKQTPNIQTDVSCIRVENGVQIHTAGLVKNVLFYGPKTVRVNTLAGPVHTTHPSLTVVGSPSAPAFTLDKKGDDFVIRSSSLHIIVDGQSGALTFLRPNGSVITREKADQPSSVREVIISDAPTYEVSQTFTLSPKESLYGLGQYNQRYMDYRGQKVLLVQTNIGIVVPFLLSTNRYGIMWDVYSKTTFADNSQGATFWSESSPEGVDYYFIAGEDMDDVIAGYRDLTGHAPMFPKSAFGLFMSKERYKTQDRLIEVVKEFRENQFPLDNIVQDWQYWGGNDGTWSGMIWDKSRYPNPKALTDTLHNELHVKLMNSIWPSVGNDTELGHELDEHGLRFEPLHWISKKARIYDAFSDLGRAIYFKYIKQGLLDVGVDALWMDGTEVEVDSACHDPNKVEADIKGLGKNAMGDFTRYLNVYSLLTTKGTYEGQRATGNKRVLTLTRSSFTGQQRYGALAWSGDTQAEWNELNNQIAGGLNVAMAGQPYWTQDTGGFFIPGKWRPNGKTSPEYNELFARWHQFGIFNPLYRIHGTDIEREPYVFKKSDPEVYDSLLQASHLRYRLLPYIYGLAWQSTSAGYTMMRGLAMDFPDDLNARKIDDTYMFGPAFLVHPITRPMYRVPPPPVPTIPEQYFTTPEGKPGISVQYFTDENFTHPAGVQIASTVDNTWPGPPLTDLPPGLDSVYHFSDRWDGYITMPETGIYQIGAEGDDGIRVWLDNQLVVEDWGTHAMRWFDKRLTFTQGQKVHLRIDHFQGDGGRGIRLGWRTPSMLKTQPAKPQVENIASTYLPSGADWYDFWTNQRHHGGQNIEQPVPLNRLPLFIRAGSIVPMGPVVQYATEKPDAPYEIRIYPGADASFTLYQDDNETYNYEKGERATVLLKWDDQNKTLNIGQRQGSFPGMVSERLLHVVMCRPGHGDGIESQAPDKSIRYTGQATSLQF